MSNSLTLAIAAIAALASGCRAATVDDVPAPGCYAAEVVSCEACHDRDCSWCPEGADPADGYCCAPACVGTPLHCPNAIAPREACPQIGPCATSTITTCGVCQLRGCYWCPNDPARSGEGRGRCRGPDPMNGAPPSCEGRIDQAETCPGSP